MQGWHKMQARQPRSKATLLAASRSCTPSGSAKRSLLVSLKRSALACFQSQVWQRSPQRQPPNQQQRQPPWRCLGRRPSLPRGLSTQLACLRGGPRRPTGTFEPRLPQSTHHSTWQLEQGLSSCWNISFCFMTCGSGTAERDTHTSSSWSCLPNQLPLFLTTWNMVVVVVVVVMP